MAAAAEKFEAVQHVETTSTSPCSELDVDYQINGPSRSVAGGTDTQDKTCSFDWYYAR